MLNKKMEEFVVGTISSCKLSLSNCALVDLRFISRNKGNLVVIKGYLPRSCTKVSEDQVYGIDQDLYGTHPPNKDSDELLPTVNSEIMTKFGTLTAVFSPSGVPL